MVSIAAVSPALQAAGFIGTWDTDVPAGLSVLDEGAAQMLAGNAGLAGQLVPLDVALGRTHPDDRGWLFDRIRRVRQAGGPVSAEFRILTDTGDVRWILNRGCLAPDERGAMHGCGAYIDTTDSHCSLSLPDHPIEIYETDPLIVAVDRCIAAHAAIDRVGDRGLRRLSDMMLFAIGRTLAGRTRT